MKTYIKITILILISFFITNCEDKKNVASLNNPMIKGEYYSIAKGNVITKNKDNSVIKLLVTKSTTTAILVSGSASIK